MEKYSYYKRREFIKHIGRVCGDFRKERLRLTLHEMGQAAGIPISTLNSFELGRSSSLNMFYIYLISCKTQAQIKEFLQYIVEVCLIDWRQ